MSKKENNIVHATDEGRLYIKTVDFFKQPKIQQTIEDLLSSDIIKNIDSRNSEKNKNLQEI